MSTTLSQGDKLTHSESGLEAEYVTALPTAGHGFIHLLKSAEGYIFRLTGDLENEFAQEGESATLAQTGAGVSSAEADLFARMEKMLARMESAGLSTSDLGGDVAAPAAASPVAPAPASPVAPVPDASAHLSPAQASVGLASVADAPEAEEDAPPAPAESVTPPANSIPF